VEPLIVIVLGLLGIAAAAAVAPRIGVAAPLLLVLSGIAVSLLPVVPPVHVEPEWVLAGVLPPLLYSAAVSMPAMDFRREFRAIGGLSVVLVVVSALVIGWSATLLVPGLPFAWGVALGAVVSPTDAVATSIVARLGVSPRVVAVLEGEGLLNDATALVLLRTAVAGAAASVSLGGVLGEFLFAVVGAAAIGFAVGHLDLLVRSRVRDATVNTVLSFTVPFLASLPAEEVGASGLVAAVVAGLVTGHGAPRVLSPQHRLSDAQNWRTVELVLEGAVFLATGLQLVTVVQDVRADHAGIGTAVAVAAAALALSVVVRAAYVAPLLAGLQRRARRGGAQRERIVLMQDQLTDPATAATAFDRPGARPRRRPTPSAGQLERMRTRVRRLVADIDFFLAAPLGWRDGAVVVWAGMRGAVTVAAAQTIPEDAPSRSLLVLVAFLVAIASLLLQGGTLPRLVRVLGAAPGEPGRAAADERTALHELLERTAAEATAAHRAAADDRAPGAADDDEKALGVAVVTAQRLALLDARDDGTYSAGALNAALAVLDAEQISLELRGAPAG